MEYVILTIGLVAVLAAWDFGRRFVASRLEFAAQEHIVRLDAEIADVRRLVDKAGATSQQALERTAKVSAFLDAQKMSSPPRLRAR